MKTNKQLKQEMVKKYPFLIDLAFQKKEKEFLKIIEMYPLAESIAVKTPYQIREEIKNKIRRIK